MPPVQQVGLVAVMDVRTFQTGVQAYLRGLNQVNAATNQAASTMTRAGSVIENAFAVGIGVAAVRAVESLIGAFRGLYQEGLQAVQFAERLKFALGTLAAIDLAEVRGTDVASQLEEATELAEGYLLALQDLAVFSPFTTEQIAPALRLLKVYGFGIEEALALTEKLVDFGSGAGLTADELRRIALATGQIRAEGRLLARDALQLVSAGVPIYDIVQKYANLSLEDMTRLRQEGMIPAQTALEALDEYLTQFEGSGVRVSQTINGLISSLEDLRGIAFRELFTGFFTPIIPILQEMVDLLSSEEMRAGLRVAGELIGTYVAGAIEFLRTAIGNLIATWQGLDPTVQQAIITFIGAAAALTLFAGTVGLLVVAINALINPFTLVVGALSAFVAVWVSDIGGLRTRTESLVNRINVTWQRVAQNFQSVVSAVGQATTDLAVYWQQLAQEAISWGTNIVNSIAEGVVGAVNVVAQAIAAIGSMFTYWMAPGSPPRFLPDLTQWGTDAAAEYLSGWTQVDFDILSDLSSQLSAYLGDIATLGDLDEQAVPGIIRNLRTELAQAVQETIEFGHVTEETFGALRDAAGPAGDYVVAYVDAFEELAVASRIAEQAQKKLNQETAKYEALLRPLRLELQGIQNQRSDAENVGEIRQLTRLIANEGVSEFRKEAARARLREIAVQSQINALELQRDVATEGAQAELDAANEVKNEAQAQIDILRARFEVQADQVGLLAEEEQIMARLARGARGVSDALSKALDPLQKQLRAIKLQQEELAGAKRLAQARLVLEDQNATAAEKAAAQLVIQEETLKQQIRDIEAAELGVNLENLRQIQFTMEELVGEGKGGNPFAEMTEGLDVLAERNPTKLMEDFNESVKGVREEFEKTKEEWVAMVAAINENLPPFLQITRDADGTIPALQSVQRALAGLTAIFVGGRLIALIRGAAQVLLFFGTKANLIGLVLSALFAVWQFNLFGIRDVTQEAISNALVWLNKLIGGEGDEGVGGIWAYLQTIGPSIQEWFANLGPNIRSGLDTARQSTTDFVLGLDEMFLGWIENLRTGIIAGLRYLFSYEMLLILWGFLANAIVWAGRAAAALISFLPTLLGRTLAGLGYWIGEALQFLIGTAIPALIRWGIQAGTAFISWIAQAVPKAIAGLYSAVLSIGNYMRTGFYNDLTAAAEFAWQALKDGLLVALPALSEAFATILGGLVTGLGELLIGFIQFGTNIAHGIRDGLIDAFGPETGASIYAAVKNGFLLVFSPAGLTLYVKEKATELGGGVIDGIVDGIRAAPEAVQTAIQDFVDDTVIGGLKRRLGIESPSKVAADEVGAPTAEGIVDGFSELDSDALSEILKTALTKALEEVSQTAIDSGKNAYTETTAWWKRLTEEVIRTVNLWMFVSNAQWNTYKLNFSTLVNTMLTEHMAAWNNFFSAMLSNTRYFHAEILSLWNQFAVDFMNIVDALIADVVDAFDQMVTDVTTAIGNMNTAIITAFQTLADEIEEDVNTIGKQLGDAFVDGIIEAIEDRSDDLRGAGAGAFEDVESGAEAAGDIGSPSRKAAQNIGLPIAQGIAAGIREGQSDMNAAIQSVFAQMMAAVGRTGLSAPSQITNVSNVSRTNNFNLNVTSTQPSDGIAADFGLMEMMST